MLEHHIAQAGFGLEASPKQVVAQASQGAEDQTNGAVPAHQSLDLYHLLLALGDVSHQIGAFVGFCIVVVSSKGIAVFCSLRREASLAGCTCPSKLIS